MKPVENKKTEADFTVTEYPCPVCGMKMFTEPTLRGATLWCGYNIPQPDGYHCREVQASGKTAKDAYSTIKEKFDYGLKERRNRK